MCRMVIKYTPRKKYRSTPHYFARKYLWTICMTRKGKYTLYMTPRRKVKYTDNVKRIRGIRRSFLTVFTPYRTLMFKLPTNTRVRLDYNKETIDFMCIKKYLRTKVHSLADLIRATVGGGLHAFRVIMEVRGLGYKVFIKQPHQVDLKLGFSHMVYFKLKNKMYARAMGIKSRVFAVFGYDLIQVTACAAHIRTMRRINVYKGKGIFKKYFRYKVKEGKRKKN